MLAVYAAAMIPDDPLSGLAVGETPDPSPAEGWTTVTVKAAALNHHDLWSLRGVGLSAERLPMILGCDAAGRSTTADVVVHAVIGDSWRGDETLDPTRSLLSERHPGTLADRWRCRRATSSRSRPSSPWPRACLPTAWLTAYRMLATGRARGRRDGARAGRRRRRRDSRDRLGSAAGVRVWVTSRVEAKRAGALELGRRPGLRIRRPAARARRRGDGDRGRGDLGALAQGASAGRHARGVGCHDWRPRAPSSPACSSSSSTSRLHDGHARRARAAHAGSAAGARRPPRGHHATLPLLEAREGFSALLDGDVVGKVVFTT